MVFRVSVCAWLLSLAVVSEARLGKDDPKHRELMAINCPATAGESIPLLVEPNGDYSLNIVSESNRLCTLSLVTTDPQSGEESFVPIGRSYAGNDWEGVKPLAIPFDCSRDANGASCTTMLPLLETGQQYRLTTFERSPLSRDKEAARLLTQTTFGPTRDSVNDYLANYDSPAAFVESQMMVDSTLHRAYFRKNCQARNVASYRVGRPRTPCEAGSHWRRFALTNEDKDQRFSVSSGPAPYLFSVNGQPRTQFMELPSPLFPGAVGGICGWPVNRIGGRVRINAGNGCKSFSNPEVQFFQDPSDIFQDTSTILLELSGSFQLRDNNETLIHEDAIAGDPHGSCYFTDGKTDVFGQDTLTGQWFIHDPILMLRDNTPTQPLLDGGSSSAPNSYCASAPFVFLDDEFCVFSDDPQACGNRGIVCPGDESEVANDPSSQVSFDMVGADEKKDKTRGDRLDFEHTKWTTWINVVMKSPDQLRQRVAWAFSQILVNADNGLLHTETEPYLSFYDIFVRNAFGNFRDILREVSFHPLMGSSLSFEGSKSTEYVHGRTGKYVFPDENYAREVMQLFSIGLWMLNEDGTLIVDSGSGNPVASYDMDDIMDGARAWTGFVAHKPRGNIEGKRSGNRIDPMYIHQAYRDHFPKKSVNGGGYIADGVPLCTDLPDKHWLRKGASWRVLGEDPTPDVIEQYGKWRGNGQPWIELDPADPLYPEICGTGPTCAYPTTVTLESTLPVTSTSIIASEESVRVIKVNDIFYEYVGVPCVELSFHSNAKTIKKSPKGYYGMCAASDSVQASSCCSTGRKRTKRAFPDLCSHPGERVKYDTHEARCRANGKASCIDIKRVAGNRCGPNMCCHFKMWQWTSSACSIDVKVTEEGKIAMVHVPQVVNHTWAVAPSYNADNRNYFRANWVGGDFPSPKNGCGDGTCSLSADGTTCQCQTTVETYAVYEESFILSSQQSDLGDDLVDDLVDDIGADLGALVSQLRIGSSDPTMYDAGTYTVNTTWTDSTFNLTFWQHADGAAEDMIIEVITAKADKPKFFKNKVSVVNILGKATGAPIYKFRNPPKFKGNNKRDHHYETELVLDSLFHHPNTAPFISTLLIQRFGVSNPSPAYVKRVATAFRTGLYTGGGIEFGTSEYGDLKATIAALVLDQDMRSSVLEAEPTGGSIREPLLRVLHFMKSMEYASNSDLIVFKNLEEEIGQMAHGHTSVFSFFLPKYAAPGVVSSAGLVSPEAFLFDTNRNAGLMKGLFSLVKFGLSNCYDGFGHGAQNCVTKSEGDYYQSLGRLKFIPASYDPEPMVEELDLLLTGGRLSNKSKTTIVGALGDSSINTGDQRLRLAQQLLAAAPEFHSTNNLVELDDKKSREPPSPTSEPTKRYKAIVYLMMGGGADTFNLLVPHSECTNKDMYAEYAAVRGGIAIPKDQLLQIDAGTNQTCSVFGIHPNLPVLQRLYNDEEASFFANTGVLHAPSNKYNYRKNQGGTRLFGHGQQKDVQKVDPDGDLYNTGVLGRITDTLTEHYNYLTAQTSTGRGGAAGSTVINSQPQKSPPPTHISGAFAPNPFDPVPSIANMRELVNSLNNATTLSSGMFAETWSGSMVKSLDDNDYFHRTLYEVDIDTVFPSNGIGNDLKLVSRWIKTRRDRKVERDVFAVAMGGFDTHRDMTEKTDGLYGKMNDAIESFVAEMKSQGLWDDVVLVATSEFGRTLTANGGGGTDHAWGGNYFMLGGNVEGKKIHGTYPETLTEDGPLILKRGRVVPTTGWEAVWNGVAEWFGITEQQHIDKVVPNRGSMSHLFTGDNLFKSVTYPPTSAPSNAAITDAPSVAPTPGGSFVSKTVDFFSLEARGGRRFRIDGLRLTDSRTSFAYAFDGNDYVMSMSVSGQDFDFGGSANDSLSWKVRVSGLRGVGYMMCPGMCASVAAGGTPSQISANSRWWGVVDNRIGRNGESIVFTVEDVVLTTDNPNFSVSFNGFTSVWLTKGQYIFGQGVGLEGRVKPGNGHEYFSPPHETLQVTVGKRASERITRLGGRFTVSGYV